MEKNKLSFLLILAIFVILLTSIAWAAQQDLKPGDLATATDPKENAASQDQQPILVKSQSLPDNAFTDPTRYTLGAEDVIEISVMRHPEFSGIFPVNLEGKVQFKFVGDIEVSGLTKKELEQKLRAVLANFIINPEVSVTILEYRSKYIYVIGEVGAPGKYYMRSETIPVREAVVAAGLPTLAAAMRRCRLVTPDMSGNAKFKEVDLYSILYGGDLKKNIDMRAGEILYVPATVMAKIIRVINPVTSAVGVSSSGPEGVSTIKSSVSTLAK